MKIAVTSPPYILLSVKRESNCIKNTYKLFDSYIRMVSTNSEESVLISVYKIYAQSILVDRDSELLEEWELIGTLEIEEPKEITIKLK